jgi:hypothetical protein
MNSSDDFVFIIVVVVVVAVAVAVAVVVGGGYQPSSSPVSA